MVICDNVDGHKGSCKIPKKFICNFRFTKEIMSDRGTAFTSIDFDTFIFWKLSIEKWLLPYHRLMVLSKESTDLWNRHCESEDEVWEDQLHYIQYVINNIKHSATQLSPLRKFDVMFDIRHIAQFMIYREFFSSSKETSNYYLNPQKFFLRCNVPQCHIIIYA